jgi:hypothetical protein
MLTGIRSSIRTFGRPGVRRAGNGEIATACRVVGMPSAVLLDRAGHVRFQHVVFSEERKDEYETHVQSVLGEPVAH